MNTTIVCFIAWLVLQGTVLGHAIGEDSLTGKHQAKEAFKTLIAQLLVAALMYGFGAFERVFP